MPGVATTSATRIAQAERRTQYVNLRKAGYTYERIAAHFGVTRQAVYSGVKKALDEIKAEGVPELRALENERLDDMLRAIYAQAVKGDTGAIDRILRIMERRAKLWGLDAPVRSVVDNGGTTRILIEYASDSNDPAPEAA